MSLVEYEKKRKFNKTPEPKAVTKKSLSKKLISREQKYKGKVKRRKPIRLSCYLIHEHHASHLHWDLRLEMDGVLKSWAVPKIPPTAKGTKRLVIHVEDHPISYAKFHGVIPEGNYGAGKVIIWDSGKYELLKKSPKEILVDIHGKKLKGQYALIKTNYGGKKNSWLFFKI